MMKIISFFTGFLVALMLPWYIKTIQKISEQEIESDAPALEQDDIAWLEAVAAMHAPQHEVAHKPRAGVWLAEDALTGIPYVLQNGEWVEVNRDF